MSCSRRSAARPERGPRPAAHAPRRPARGARDRATLIRAAMVARVLREGAVDAVRAAHRGPRPEQQPQPARRLHLPLARHRRGASAERRRASVSSRRRRRPDPGGGGDRRGARRHAPGPCSSRCGRATSWRGGSTAGSASATSGSGAATTALARTRSSWSSGWTPDEPGWRRYPGDGRCGDPAEPRDRRLGHVRVRDRVRGPRRPRCDRRDLREGALPGTLRREAAAAAGRDVRPAC